MRTENSKVKESIFIENEKYNDEATVNSTRKKVGRKKGQKTKSKGFISSIDGFNGVFKPIQGYDGLYYITENGRVYSSIQNKWLKPYINQSGYPTVNLQMNKKYIHRLVAEAFIPNPDNLPVVNHKDENKLNSSVDNLEWCTYEYNNNYGTAKERMVKTKASKQKINKYELLTNIVHILELNDVQKQLLNNYLQQIKL